ncbi:MAG: transporter substrate-binding domain-containing protein [Lactobacillus sp.]|jgi:cystine transport system substrate-binding protein|uniref:Transporter substrate-binding domain-containing protein n=1 Tax=Lacticaseibacillus suilingensis TaxID=2799577 RepID=A0ABW4BFE1_9LACO|nr:transporter substrate-binding domain-containing protein [Lacticaseibacillus suilingensis]MCI1893851.1 transporter substrate-binding domain-containing protein [Lactobacillus sp.]MCI1917646.1 transporter substrate-binding domain-containing protein [Lactobacillus sp.]MCI1941642.1 transporter substrate-binding domain-containing protein [Lactobacillus sp.]MCI1972188.1 transporter substrate-binding domain-containing protein [Lactobacillus sp.]MCI2017127.1 transporter substrate-binding domain-cont
MKKWLLALTSLVLLGALAACGSKPASKDAGSDMKLVTPKTLTIGLEGTYQPYSYHENGKLTGFEVELGKKIAAELNLKPKFVETKWDSLIAGLDVNKYDLILNNVAKTPERAAKYRFTAPYTSGKSQLAVKKDNTTIKSITDIKGKKMAQSVTSNNAANVKKMGGVIVPVEGFAQSVTLIEQGRAEGTVNEAAAFYSYLKQQPNADIKLISVGNAFKANPARGLLRKDEGTLQKKVTQAIEKLRKNGQLGQLSKKYFGSDITK